MLSLRNKTGHDKIVQASRVLKILIAFCVGFSLREKRAKTHNLSDLFQHIVGVILNKVWLTIEIFVLISGILFAYLACFSARLENKQDEKCRTSADASSRTARHT